MDRKDIEKNIYLFDIEKTDNLDAGFNECIPFAELEDRVID